MKMNSQRAARGVKESLREGWMTQIIQERPKSGLKRKMGLTSVSLQVKCVLSGPLLNETKKSQDTALR